jgi:hypothetical protein
MTETSKAEIGRFLIQGTFTDSQENLLQLRNMEVLMCSNLVCIG